MTSSCDKLRRALLSCLSRPDDFESWWRFTPKKLAKEIDESASVVVGARMMSHVLFSRDNGGEQHSHVSLGQLFVKAGYMDSPAPRGGGAEGTE